MFAMKGAAKDVRSPFCTGSPINTLAEPEDLVIVCGEFNSGIQIMSQSEEPDQVFTVKKIVNYPHYNPKRVCFAYVCYIQKAAFFQEGIGEGGPYEGNDICVYHVETDFLLGDDVEIDGRNQSSQPWIWPVCLPKNDDDPEFESDRGIIAGWLDAPPIDQTFTKLLGSGVSEAEVYRFVIIKIKNETYLDTIHY